MTKTSNNRQLEHGICANPRCQVCGNDRDFEMPAQVIDALIARKLVIFAGAGISTESRVARGKDHSFYARIHDKFPVEQTDRRPFPNLMSQFSATFGRAALLQEIKKHLEYGDQFAEVRNAATRFHREMATIPYLDEIYTTNWDDYFETECFATPYVTADDFAFWDLPGRKVFKLHGSIRNVGSLIVTAEDYSRCYKALRDGLIGSTLKLALATKTVVFLGYSLTDPDFLRLWKLVHNELGNIVPTAYWVTIDSTTLKSSVPKGLNVIEADATFFLQNVKAQLVERDMMIPDDQWLHSMLLAGLISKEHRSLHKHFRLNKSPEMLFSAFYQDGVAHACGAILQLAFAGKASHRCYISQLVDFYVDLSAERLRNRNYGDVAYIEGYINGLIYPLMGVPDRKRIPKYFLFGPVGDITSFAQYRKLRKQASELHKSAYAWAKRAAALYEEAHGSIVIHHRPFL